MQLPEDQSVLGALVAGAVASCGFVAMWLWNNTMGRIRALEKGKVDKEVFDSYTKAAEQSRAELRESIIKLFDKIDELKDMVRDK